MPRLIPIVPAFGEVCIDSIPAEEKMRGSIFLPLQASLATMRFRWLHKIVREIPHALQQGIGSGMATIAFSCFLALGMMLS
jgi:hypothetical protein